MYLSNSCIAKLLRYMCSKETHHILFTLCCYSKTGSCDEVAVLCMEVLANMCRCSVSVRAHIKGQVCVK